MVLTPKRKNSLLPIALALLHCLYYGLVISTRALLIHLETPLPILLSTTNPHPPK